MFCSDQLSIAIHNSLKFGLFSADVPVLVYYSHLTAVVVSLFLSFFIFNHNRKFLPSKILFAIALLFSALSFIDIALWTQIDSAIIMYAWSFWLPLFITIFFLSFYFLYTFIKKKDIAFPIKASATAVVLAIFYLSFTDLNLAYFDVHNCNASEGQIMINTVFTLSFIIFVSVLVFGIRHVRKIDKANKEERKLTIFTTIGVSCFLLVFSSATYYASIANMFGGEPDIFKFEQYGYFGMTLFIAVLAYIIVRYNAFNIKFLAAQALVFAFIILIASQFLFVRNNTNKVLTAITLLLAMIFGFFLTRSVKKEVEAKERVQRLANDLERSNARLRDLDKQKTEFISFATHQLRSPLTAIKGNTSLILEGDMGPVSEIVRGGIETIYTSIKTMISIVEDYLNVSRIELGTMQYTMTHLDFKDILKEVVNEQKTNIEAKGLAYYVSLDENEVYPINADSDKFKQVIINTIDNSVKYTATGSLTIRLTKDPARHIIRLIIADTGVGIAPDVMPKLFQKFSRAKNASASNIHGTGLGLFIGKEIMNAHHGKIWAESEGEGKGSQFYIEVPEVITHGNKN